MILNKRGIGALSPGLTYILYAVLILIAFVIVILALKEYGPSSLLNLK